MRSMRLAEILVIVTFTAAVKSCPMIHRIYFQPAACKKCADLSGASLTDDAKCVFATCLDLNPIDTSREAGNGFWCSSQKRYNDCDPFGDMCRGGCAQLDDDWGRENVRKGHNTLIKLFKLK